MDKDIENWLVLEEEPGLYIGNKTLRDAKNWSIIKNANSLMGKKTCKTVQRPKS
jgi:hypothetical protein